MKHKHLLKKYKEGYERAVSPFGEEIGKMYLTDEDQDYVVRYRCKCGKEMKFHIMEDEKDQQPKEFFL